MPLKNSNTVAAERRVDLASLFCMIGRHGPAVALAVIAMVSVLAGFIIYRTVRGKRRKATDAAADGDGKSPEEERDAAVIQLSPEESHSSAESTDVSDEFSSDVKEDVDLIQSDLKIRHRRAAAAAAVEKKPPPYSPLRSDIQAPENKPTTSDEEMAAVWDCKGATDDIVEDVMEEVHDNDGCLKEPEPIYDENQEEEEKVLKAECQEVEDVTTNKDVSDKKTRQEEENLQCALNNPVSFEQTPHMGEAGDDDRLQDNKTILETNNSEKPAIHIKDIPASCICSGKDEDLEEENPDSIDYSSYSGNTCLSPEREKKNDGERTAEECEDHQVTAQQVEIWPSTFEQDTNLPSAQQDQCDLVTDKVMPPIQDGDWDEDDGLAGEATEEVVDEDHLDKHTAVKFDTYSLQFDEKEVAIEQKEDDGLMCKQEDGVLYDCADQAKEEMLSGDSIGSCSEESDSSSVGCPCLSMDVKVDNHDNGLSGIITDAKAQISGIADFPDLSLGCQPQTEDKTALSLNEDADFTILSPQMPSHEIENLPENNQNSRTVVLAEECNDQVYDPDAQSCYKDQESVKMSVAADPSAVEDISTSVIVEEISCPDLPSICQDVQSDCMENDDTSNEMRVNSATDAGDCNNATVITLSVSEEICHADMLSSSQEQQSDHMENNEDFSAATGAAPVMTKDIGAPIGKIYFPSFEQSELRDDVISSPDVGEESGISSMAVSPELQNAANEFGVTVGNMVLPVMDCELQPGGRTEAQNSLFADDVPTSVINEDTTGMAFRPYQSPRSEHTDWTKYEAFATNEDMFGHEIEDGYHRAMDLLTAQIAANVSSYINVPKIQTDMKAEVVEMKEKKARVNVEKKENTKAEEKEEDYEKTEISIMEATMDNNEWITETNYPVLPWLNLSASSFAQDHTKTNQLATEECQCSSAVTDAACIDTTDIPPSNEAKQTSTLSHLDENTENNKKVVAVQPMPQNINVTFRVHYFTQSPYQTVAVTGNQEELGNWKGFIPLERAKDGHWATVVSLPAEIHVEWKFVVVEKGEVCRWEECGNRLLDTGYVDDLLVHKWWGLL
ncbi:uncharacterized protein stbd1 isoform X2 [Chaetodon trifascialis]|uniref:uncharacterized protein stbd1 isoform X2 n=1 Tax=Chaetodon trifascialis TaxID=109706 RepID=UPI00399358B6